MSKKQIVMGWQQCEDSLAAFLGTPQQTTTHCNTHAEKAGCHGHGVAMMSRLPTFLGLFCTSDSFAKDLYEKWAIFQKCCQFFVGIVFLWFAWLARTRRGGGVLSNGTND